MRKREGLILGFALILFLISITFISATTNSTNSTTASLAGFDKSYSCLKDQVNSKLSGAMTTEELSFSLLALGYDADMQSKLKSKLDDLTSDGSCWPKSGCTLKDTAQVLLAYNSIGANTDKMENWLKNQTQAPSELSWYLQIDSDSTDTATCTITVDNSSARTVTVNPDKTITGSIGGCFSSANNGVWLQVSRDCYYKNIDISCNKDFLTNLIYKKNSAQTIYVSALTNSAAAGGKTTESVESACFKQSSTCNYEGSLWAALALQKVGDDVKSYIPYLLTLASDNQRYAPDVFLYMLTTGFDEYFTNIINAQSKDGYWQFSDTSRRYYDTALAILALGSNEAAQSAKDYLLKPSVQGDGCFNNNIRDTSFLLYASDPKQAATTASTKSCSSNSDYQCLTLAQCNDVNGTKMNDFTCLGINFCCSEKLVQQTCSQLSGTTCSATQVCTNGDFASGLDRCCINGGTCGEAQEQDTCTTQGADYTCRTSCNANEQEETSYTCPQQGTCCSPKPVAPTKSYLWLWLLVILIILLVLAIVFRDQLKIWVFKIKSKFSKGPVAQQSRPSFPPAPQMPPQGGMPQRRIMPGQMQPRPMPSRPFPKDRELDDTLRKLKDMSK